MAAGALKDKWSNPSTFTRLDKALLQPPRTLRGCFQKISQSKMSRESFHVNFPITNLLYLKASRRELMTRWARMRRFALIKVKTLFPVRSIWIFAVDLSVLWDGVFSVNWNRNIVVGDTAWLIETMEYWFLNRYGAISCLSGNRRQALLWLAVKWSLATLFFLN